jgi:hypothetical protein
MPPFTNLLLLLFVFSLVGILYTADAAGGGRRSRSSIALHVPRRSQRELSFRLELARPGSSRLLTPDGRFFNATTAVASSELRRRQIVARIAAAVSAFRFLKDTYEPKTDRQTDRQIP